MQKVEIERNKELTVRFEKDIQSGDVSPKHIPSVREIQNILRQQIEILEVNVVV